MQLKELTAKQDIDQRLKDISKNLLFSVALSSGGMAYKDEMKSFYKIIAKELKELIDNDLLKNINLYKFHNNYIRVNSQNTNICFLKNNIFNKDCKITIDRWLEQKLVYLEDNILPEFLTNKEKEVLINAVDDDLESIIYRNYSRQELNKERFILTLNESDKEVLLRIFKKYNYYDINVRKYIEILSDDYNYNFNSYFENKKLKDAYNNYILEIGLMISKEIESYLNNR